jgi:UDP-N-acetylglucosamine acyltransferase
MSVPAQIHPTALVDPKAELADGVVVGPYTLIGPHVRIGEGTVIGNNVVITGRTTIGRRNRIFTGAVLGSEPQDVKYAGEVCYVEIGDDNVIREYATVNPGTGEGSKTVVGNDTWLMMNVHVAHNCVIGNHVKLANVASLAGHVRVDDYAIIGGLTPVHQFVRIGRNVMIGGGLRVPQDVVPYTLANGEPLQANGLNSVGLERCGFPPETVRVLKEAYRIIFRRKLTTQEAIRALQADLPQIPEVGVLVEFLSTSQRGFTR